MEKQKSSQNLSLFPWNIYAARISGFCYTSKVTSITHKHCGCRFRAYEYSVICMYVWMSHQNQIHFIGIFCREGSVHSQSDTIAENCDEDKKLEGFPFHELDAFFSESIFDWETVYGSGRPIRWRLGSYPPGWLLLHRFVLWQRQPVRPERLGGHPTGCSVSRWGWTTAAIVVVVGRHHAAASVGRGAVVLVDAIGPTYAAHAAPDSAALTCRTAAAGGGVVSGMTSTRRITWKTAEKKRVIWKIVGAKISKCEKITTTRSFQTNP